MKRSALASILVLALAAACGASSTPNGTGAAASASASSTATASSASPTSTANLPSTANACTIVTKADAEAVVGIVSDTPSATAATLPGVAERGEVCAFRGASGILTVGVLTKATTRADFDSIAKQVPGIQAISGLGDAAYGTSAGAGSANGATVLVLKGTTYISLSVTSPSTSGDALFSSLKTLAGKAVAKL